MERLRTKAPPAKELDGIKNNMAGVFTIQNSSRSGLIGQLQFADLHGLGDDYLGTYVKKVGRHPPEDVRGTAQKRLDPARVSVAVVGDKKVVEPQLGQFKPISPLAPPFGRGVLAPKGNRARLATGIVPPPRA